MLLLSLSFACSQNGIWLEKNERKNERSIAPQNAIVMLFLVSPVRAQDVLVAWLPFMSCLHAVFPQNIAPEIRITSASFQLLQCALSSSSV
jgi:hypothetical protein